MLPSLLASAEPDHIVNRRNLKAVGLSSRGSTASPGNHDSAGPFGINAVYTPAGRDPVSVRVIARRPDTIVGFGETRVHTETAPFELRASEIPSPRPDDQLNVGGETFTVQGEPERRDPERLVWTLDARQT